MARCCEARNQWPKLQSREFGLRTLICLDSPSSMSVENGKCLTGTAGFVGPLCWSALMGIEAHRKKMAMCGSLFCVALLLGYGTWSATANALGTVNVLERSYTKSRTGVNAAETVLAPTNV